MITREHINNEEIILFYSIGKPSTTETLDTADQTDQNKTYL